MVYQKRIDKITDALKDHRGAYSFYFYPGASLTSDGQFLQYHVALVTSETAQEALGTLRRLDPSISIFDQHQTNRSAKQTSHQDVSAPDEEYAKSVLARLYGSKFIDRNIYYRWLRPTNGMPAFAFRGHDQKSVLKSLAINHRRNTPNLEGHRISIDNFLNRFLESLSLFFGIDTEGGADVLKQLQDAGFIDTIHLRQDHQYRRAV